MSISILFMDSKQGLRVMLVWKKENMVGSQFPKVMDCNLQPENQLESQDVYERWLMSYVTSVQCCLYYY
jgi:hypothetical protein